MSKKLVIFGCGYLGSAYARQALGQGQEVVALTRNPSTAVALREAGIGKVVEAELSDDAWHGEIDAEQDCVLNCVGSGSDGIGGYIRSYVHGQDSIMRWAESGRVGTFVFTGSTSVYPQTDRCLVDEKADSTGVSEKGGLLLAAEKIGFDKPDSVGRSFILRLAGLYGPGRHLLLDHVREGTNAIKGNGDRILNLIHRDDACSAIRACFDAPETNMGRIYNVSDGSHATRLEITEWLANRLGVDPPGFAGAQDGDGPNRQISNARIRDDLGWSPAYPSYREGYEEML